MKKTIATLILTAATLFSTANLNAQEATINTAESSIHWLAKKVAGQHEGNINLVSGSLMMNDGILTGGSFVVETIFQIPGLGRFYVEAAFNRDYTMILGTTIFFSALIIFFNLLSDIAVLLMNPRARSQA